MASFVYFIRSESGRLKIGTASDVFRRLSALQTSSPEHLEVIGVCDGGRSREREIHSIFRAHRLSGEWFEETPAIREWIEDNAVPYDPLRHTAPVPDDRIRELAAASRMLKSLAHPPLRGETKDQQLRRVAAMFSSIRFSRVRGIWYEDHDIRLRANEFNEIVRVSGSNDRLRPTEKIAHDPQDPVLSAIVALTLKVDRLAQSVDTLRKVITRESGRTWLELLHNSLPETASGKDRPQ